MTVVWMLAHNQTIGWSRCLPPLSHSEDLTMTSVFYLAPTASLTFKVHAKWDVQSGTRYHGSHNGGE